MTAAYLRVSTAGQADSGLGLEAQRGKVAALAEIHDLAIAETYCDAGASAASLDRPELGRLLDAIRAGAVDAVLISGLDRITRSVRDLDALLELFNGAGCRLISAGESLDTESAGGRMVIGIMAVISQWERERIAERTRAALAAKRAQGLRAGTVPYGQRAGEDGRLAPDAGEQAVITAARAMRARGASLPQIARRLNAAGYRTRRGGRWSHQGVRQTLLRPAA